jgi:hypothetical protein
MKKILSLLLTLCLLSGVFATPAFAVPSSTPYSDAFADAVGEYKYGQYEEFAELINLLVELDDVDELVNVYDAAFYDLSASARERIATEGFFNENSKLVLEDLAGYIEFADFSAIELISYYPENGSLDENVFAVKLNTAGDFETCLEDAYPDVPLGATGIDSLRNAVGGLETLLTVLWVADTTKDSTVLRVELFDNVASEAANLTISDTKFDDLIVLCDIYLDDNLSDKDDIRIAMERFVTHYNVSASGGDRGLIFNYLEDNGLVSIKPASGSDTGGGGGGGGTLPPVEEPVVEPEENEDLQDELEDESAVEVPAEVTIDGDSAVADVQVDGDTVNDALEKALEVVADLEEDGRELQPTLVIEAISVVEEGVKIDEVNISLPLGDLQAAEEEGVEVALKTDLGTVVFNTEDILNGTDVGDQGSAQLELSMITVDAEEFEDMDIPSDALIVDMTFEVNGVTLDHFKEAIKVKIPYTLKEGESPEDVTVFWIDETGTPVPVGGTYNPATGMVTFLTDHFSKYFAQTATREFADVTSSHWGHEFIVNMAGKGYVSGYADDTYRPNGEITRAEFVTILVQMYTLNGSVDEMDFDDIAADDWYAPYVAAGFANGVVSGKTANTFDPNGKISRQEAAAMLSNVLVVEGYSPVTEETLLNQFADQTEISSWASTAVANCYAHSLFSGRADGCFAPGDNLSRAEAATMLYNLLNLK